MSECFTWGSFWLYIQCCVVVEDAEGVSPSLLDWGLYDGVHTTFILLGGSSFGFLGGPTDKLPACKILVSRDTPQSMGIMGYAWSTIVRVS